MSPRILNSLYSRLTLALFILLSTVGIGLYFLAGYVMQVYQQEVTQRLNSTLAANIAQETELFKFGQVNRPALQDIFNMLMVLNPSIEVYLLDEEGNVLADAAPENKIKRPRVDMAPVMKFISGSKDYPLVGDDPRAQDARKVFSVAPVQIGEARTAYLYAIIGGEDYDAIAAMSQGSYVQRLMITGLALSLLVALVFGLLIFSLLTRRLSRLSLRMDGYAQDVAGGSKAADHSARAPGDEVARLEASFAAMATRIDASVEELRRVDAKRRELIASVSHDLRTPLASMTGYLETLLLKDTTIGADDRKRYVQIAYSHSQDLGRLVAELFELARLDSVESLMNIEPFSVGELLQDVAQKYRLTAAERCIALRTELDRTSSFAYGDIGLIQRVLENLVENALRHTPPDGAVTLALTQGRDKITVKVMDTGCGISAHELPHIFDRFYRVQKSRADSQQHAGLGLAIAKRIVTLHGGTIAADSELDHGTTVSFSMPLYQPSMMRLTN